MSQTPTLRILVPVANGSEELETVAIVDTLRRAGLDVTLASVHSDARVVCSRKMVLLADAGRCTDWWLCRWCVFFYIITLAIYTICCTVSLLRLPQPPRSTALFCPAACLVLSIYATVVRSLRCFTLKGTEGDCECLFFLFFCFYFIFNFMIFIIIYLFIIIIILFIYYYYYF
jgi:hypothetical protein